MLPLVFSASESTSLWRYAYLYYYFFHPRLVIVIVIVVKHLEKGQQNLSTDGGSFMRQHMTELDGNNWHVACVPLGILALKSSPTLV